MPIPTRKPPKSSRLKRDAEIDIKVPSIAERDRVLESLHAIIERQDIVGTRATLKGQFHRPPLEPAEGFEDFKKIVEETGEAIDMPIR